MYRASQGDNDRRRLGIHETPSPVASVHGISDPVRYFPWHPLVRWSYKPAHFQSNASESAT